MTQYIEKALVVAEIERRRDYYKRNPLLINAEYCVDEDNTILKYLDTLEVKEVDLEKAIDGLTAGWIEGEEYGELQNINTCRCVTLGEVKEAMRCMFELGLKAAQKVEE